MADSFHLLVAIPEKDPVSYPLESDTVSLGRSPDNDIQLLIREVSTRHCKFTKTETGGFKIEDLGSTNGTKVNGQSVSVATPLVDRDALLLGETVPAYFVKAEGSIDARAIIEEIKKNSGGAPVAAVAAAPVEDSGPKPSVKKLAPPAAKKIGLAPAAKPASPPAPLKPTVASAGEAGSTTVKLAKTPPAPGKPSAPGIPPVKKLAPPTAPPSGGAAPPKPSAPPVKKLAVPPKKDAPRLNVPKKDD